MDSMTRDRSIRMAATDLTQQPASTPLEVNGLSVRVGDDAVMEALPAGTVTMVFTDVEASTALLSRLGSAYAETLDAHRLVLRRAWMAHGGTEMGTEGDSFFVVFPSAPEAVAAVAQAQRDLAGAEWPAGEQVRVRIGVHTGSPVVHDGSYVGMDVHRAARIAAAAHGGQVVLSEATARLVDRAGLGDVQLVDLGLHQLKDIAQPERLFQLAGEGLMREFPPLKSLGTATSLPRPATPLVGRDGEVADLTALVATPGVRLVTLTGPGGSGKTRLAIAVAHHSVPGFPDGVVLRPAGSRHQRRGDVDHDRGGSGCTSAGPDPAEPLHLSGPPSPPIGVGQPGADPRRRRRGGRAAGAGTRSGGRCDLAAGVERGR